MAILLPLTLIGIGALLYFLFAGATYALPLAAGIAAGFGSASAGLSIPASLLIGVATFMIVIAIGRFAALTLAHPYARGTLIILFALPAAIAGFILTGALASLAGLASIATLLAAAGALVSGGVAAHRLVRPAS